MGEQPSPATTQPVIVRACDMCRKKKIRCEPTVEGCLQCTKYGTHCHFTPIAGKRKPRRPPGYIMQLEERLKNMEGLLESELKNKGSEESETSHDSNEPFGVFQLETHDNPQIESDPQHSLITRTVPRGTNVLKNITTPTHPSTQLWKNGTSGGRIQDSESSLSHMQPYPSQTVGVELGSFSLHSFHELPTKSVALDLVRDAFSSFNRFFPLFDEQDFLQKFHDQYPATSTNNPEWWACVNVVLSMAHRFRAMRSLETAYDNAEACGYVQNALAVVSELNILQHSLAAVQAIVGMAIILQGTPDPHAASVLIAAAVRLAQSMGLHRRSQDSTFTAAHLEQRKRVFWIAYILDKDISLRKGLPFAQDDDDMDAELPTGPLCELPSFSDGGQNINFFKSRIGLAVIQGQIYKSLYSVQATRQSAPQKAAVAQELNCILCYWSRGVSMDSEIDLVSSYQGSFTVEFIHMLILRFTYVNCLVMIDQHLPKTEQLQVDAASETGDSFTPQESICILESRKAVRLIQITPHGDYACVWILLHPFFAAVTALLNNVLRYPTSPHAQSDLHIVEPFLRLLGTLAGNVRQCSRSEEARRMHQSCNDLNQRAKEAVGLMDGGIFFD